MKTARRNQNIETFQRDNAPLPISAMMRYLRNTVYLKDERDYFLTSLWCLSTHHCKEFMYTGYIHVYSDRLCCGKSLFLQALRPLVYNPSDILISPAEERLIQTAADQTQILDQVERWGCRKILLRNILNCGFENGGCIPRVQMNGDQKHEYILYPVYSPRVLASKNKHLFGEIAKDCAFFIKMTQPPANRKFIQIGGEEHQRFVYELDELIGNWKDYASKYVGSIYDVSYFPYLNGFSYPTQRIAAPLAAVLETVYMGERTVNHARKQFVRAVETAREESSSFF